MRRIKIARVIIALLIVSFVIVSAKPAAAAPKIKKVTVKVGSKNVTKKTYTVNPDEKFTLKVTTKPANAIKKITYKSSNAKIADVWNDDKGIIRSNNPGTAKITITVTGKDKKKYKTWIKVKVKNYKISGQLSEKPTAVTVKNNGKMVYYTFTPKTSGKYYINTEMIMNSLHPWGYFAENNYYANNLKAGKKYVIKIEYTTDEEVNPYKGPVPKQLTVNFCVTQTPYYVWGDLQAEQVLARPSCIVSCVYYYSFVPKESGTYYLHTDNDDNEVQTQAFFPTEDVGQQKMNLVAGKKYYIGLEADPKDYTALIDVNWTCTNKLVISRHPKTAAFANVKLEYNKASIVDYEYRNDKPFCVAFTPSENGVYHFNCCAANENQNDHKYFVSNLEDLDENQIWDREQDGGMKLTANKTYIMVIQTADLSKKEKVKIWID